MKKTALIVLLYFFMTIVCAAQVGLDSLEVPDQNIQTNSLFSNFDKQLNTYSLNTGINFAAELSRVELNLFENFRSTLFQSATQTVRDEHYFVLTGKYQLSNKYKFGITANSKILSDDRNTLINKSTINYLTLFNELEFFENFVLSPFGGFTYNNQVGEEDNGPVYGLEGSLQNYSGSELNINSIIKFRNEDILPRRNLLRFFGLSLENRFSKAVSNKFLGKYSSSRKDFYLPADSITSSTFNIVNNIESRTETFFFSEDKMHYLDIVENVDIEFLGTLNWRTIDREKRFKNASIQSDKVFDTKINELTLGLGTAMLYHTSFFNGSIAFNFAERDEKHITKHFEGADVFFFETRSERESRKNNNSSRATITVTGDFNISVSDKFNLSIYYNKLKYDTPSSENDDDRDEILSIFRLRYTKILSPYFQAFINTEATISHIVYLFAGRSSNNNINRVLRLMTGGYYHGANVSSLNTFEVSANYSVYDFELISSTLRSLAFRQFTATDSSRISFTNNFAFIVNGYVKLSEQADLDWGEFAERPTRFLREIFADPMFVLTHHNTSFGFGLRYFSLRTFNYDKLTRIPDAHYLSIGPIIELSYFVINSIRLNINGWYEFVTLNDTPDKERVNLVMDLYWNF